VNRRKKKLQTEKRERRQMDSIQNEQTAGETDRESYRWLTDRYTKGRMDRH
jgi:hypothetical protein